MLEQIDTLIEQYSPSNQPVTTNPPPARSASNRQESPQHLLSKARSAAPYIDPDVAEREWKFSIVAPLARAAQDHPLHADEFKDLAQGISRGDFRELPSVAWSNPGHSNGKTGEEIFEATWDRFYTAQAREGGVTIGSYFFLAKQGGWKDEEESFVAQDPTPALSDAAPAMVQASNTAISQPLDRANFPHIRESANGQITLPATLENIEHLLKGYGITVRFDVIKKDLVIAIPGQRGTPEGYMNTALTQILSLATLNGISSNNITAYIEAIGNKNPINRVANWIKSKPWDGVDRFSQLHDTLKTPDSFPRVLKRIMLRRWFISAVAAALKPDDFYSRGVLTLQGHQSQGKSSWIKNLIDDSILQKEVILTSHHLDLHDKDSMIRAITHWITEFGELDGSISKAHARQKGFITNHTDKVRRPYGRGDSVYPRRTVFCASVNDSNFLVDPTGNTRWWTIPVESLDYQHGIDMQQVFAQIAEAYERGEQWWLTREEEQMLEQENSLHTQVSITSERVLETMDFDLPEAHWSNMSASQVLAAAGFKNPTNPQARECGYALRQHFGEPKKIRGIMKWRVPIDSHLVSIG